MVEKKCIYNVSWINSIFLMIQIPPIPRKNSTERFQEEVINERMRDFEVKYNTIQKFMDSLSKIIMVKNSKILNDFLSIEDNKEFQAIKKVKINTNNKGNN